ncbi:MAG TPA: methylmalonyl-CoA mutase family protein, partial [Roseiflexaceae bacterium]|nr:methylmalonyl-CoA mutase family protein [Roseiflexaceae bacterium]
ERGEQIVVGVNRFAEAEQSPVPIFYPNEQVAQEQAAGLTRVRTERDGAAVTAALDALGRAAAGSENVLPPMREALRRLATVGEVCGVLRRVWGEYRPEVRL